MGRKFRRRAPHASHARAVCYVSTEEFLTKIMPKCGCVIEGAGAVDQMKTHARSLVDITDGTFLSYTIDKLTSKALVPLVCWTLRWSHQNAYLIRHFFQAKRLELRALALSVDDGFHFPRDAHVEEVTPGCSQNSVALPGFPVLM